MARSKKRLKPVQNAKRSANSAAQTARKVPAAPPTATSLIIRVIAGAIVLAASGVAHGIWTERWHDFDATKIASERLQQLPMTVGDWDAIASELDAKTLEKAGIVGYIVRDYVNRQNGNVVSFMVLCGRPGPIAVHTPDICFRGQGYRFTAEPKFHAVNLPNSDTSAEFWTATPVRDSGGVPEHLRVLWTWIADGPCRAPENPRIEFASHPALYKLYITRQAGSSDESLDDDECVKFVRLVIPQLQSVLFDSTDRD